MSDIRKDNRYLLSHEQNGLNFVSYDWQLILMFILGIHPFVYGLVAVRTTTCFQLTAELPQRLTRQIKLKWVIASSRKLCNKLSISPSPLFRVFELQEAFHFVSLHYVETLRHVPARLLFPNLQLKESPNAFPLL